MTGTWTQKSKKIISYLCALGCASVSFVTCRDASAHKDSASVRGNSTVPSVSDGDGVHGDNTLRSDSFLGHDSSVVSDGDLHPALIDGDGVIALDGEIPIGQPGPSNRCPAGTVLVEGDYCPNVEQRCLRWVENDLIRCEEFAPPRCLGARRRISVCMDVYEYPNRRGAYPQVMVNWYQARDACAARNERLCTMSEWTFACEGPNMLPYPYGLRRDNTACNIDHQTRRPDRARLGNPATAADESVRLYEAVPSGTYDRCVSWAGVHDMTGNVDEWARNTTRRPYDSALKGGWWGPIRGRCRPVTLAHNEGFVYYQIGFRCCANPRPQ